MMALGWSGEFKRQQFTTEVILWAVRWYLTFPVDRVRTGGVGTLLLGSVGCRVRLAKKA
jgi:hypothetical protein